MFQGELDPLAEPGESRFGKSLHPQELRHLYVAALRNLLARLDLGRHRGLQPGDVPGDAPQHVPIVAGPQNMVPDGRVQACVHHLSGREHRDADALDLGLEASEGIP